MIANPKSYTKRKYSGVDLFGQVPGHWLVVTLRRTLRPYDGIKIGPFGSQLKLEHMSPSGYKVYGQANVIAHDFDLGTKFISQAKFDELSTCQVCPGDLLVTMMGTSGRCSLVPDDAALGIMDSHLLRLRTNADLDTKFASLLIDESPYVKEQVLLAGKGSIMHGLNSALIKGIILALPPVPEQIGIVHFLDYVDRRIRRYISAKQRLIALLEEQKQAIIHQVVTGQIDVRTGQPYAAYKPSGVKWLGNVPEHWELKRLKFLASIPSGQVDPRLDCHRDKMLIAPNHIAPGGGKVTELETADVQGADSGKYEVRVGDVIYSKIRPNLRKAAISPVDGLCSSDMYPIRVRKREMEPEFFLYLILSRGVTGYAVDCSMRVAMPKINRESLGDCWLCYPGMVQEQRAILRRIRTEEERCNMALEKMHREVDLIRELRTRIVADVVTGRVDVRDAPAFPEVAGLIEEADVDAPAATEVTRGMDRVRATPKSIEI